jgi:hypothetical protein
MDMVSDYKLQALDSMQKTVELLTNEVDKSRGYLDRVRDEEVRSLAESLSPDDGAIQL